MIFIDWISPPAHIAFNLGLFHALRIKETSVFIYTKELEIPGQSNTYSSTSSHRLIRALSVLRTCYKYRRRRIFFLTYDAVLLPLITLFCRKVFVFEHNTTPEGATFVKHAIWQTIFFRNITRLAVYSGQFHRLSEIGQKVVFLGHPLLDRVPLEKETGPPVLLAPSLRLDLAELFKFADLFHQYPIIVKNQVLRKNRHCSRITDLNIIGHDWINLDTYLPNTKAIIVGTTSSIRGSGWLNEAIRYGIPLIITNLNAQQLFEATYPGYPYLRPQTTVTPEGLAAELTRLRSVLADIGRSYIADYNDGLRLRFFEALKH